MAQVYNDRAARSEALLRSTEIVAHDEARYSAESIVTRAQVFYAFLIEKPVTDDA